MFSIVYSLYPYLLPSLNVLMVVLHLMVSHLRIYLKAGIHPWWGTSHSIPGPLRGSSTPRVEDTMTRNIWYDSTNTQSMPPTMRNIMHLSTPHSNPPRVKAVHPQDSTTPMMSHTASLLPTSTTSPPPSNSLTIHPP